MGRVRGEALGELQIGLETPMGSPQPPMTRDKSCAVVACLGNSLGPRKQCRPLARVVQERPNYVAQVVPPFNFWDRVYPEKDKALQP